MTFRFAPEVRGTFRLKIRRLKANKSHILTKKSAKRKRRLRRPTTVKTPGEVKHIKRLILA